MKAVIRWAVLSAIVMMSASGIPTQRDAFYYNPGLHPQPYFFPQMYQSHQPYNMQPIHYRSSIPPQYQNVIIHKQNPYIGGPSAYSAYSSSSNSYPNVYSIPASIYPIPPSPVIVPLRADAGQAGGNKPSEGYGGLLSIFNNYWSNFVGTNKEPQKPAEASGSGTGPSNAESPAASPEGSKKPEKPSEPAPVAPAAESPAAPAAPEAVAEGPAVSQRFLVLTQPHVIANPAALPDAGNGAVSTYLLLRSQSPQNHVYRSPMPAVRLPIPQQQISPSSMPLTLVRTPDSRYQVVATPTRVFINGDDQENMKVSGPGSHALAFQQFLLSRKQAPASSLYFQSAADESIAVESAVKDAGTTSSPGEESSSNSSTTAAPPASSDAGEVVDSEDRPPSIAQVKPHAIALAGVGGVASASPMGTALVGPGGMALSAPSATAVAGPSSGNPSITSPSSASTAFHNADAYRKWLSNKKKNDELDGPGVPEYLVNYNP